MYGNWYLRNICRGVSRGSISQVPRKQSGLLNWHNIPMHSNKTIKLYGLCSNKAVVILLQMITPIYTFILIYLCLPEMDLEGIQSCPRLHIPPTSENLGMFVNLFNNSIIKYNFCTSTRNNLFPAPYGRLHPPQCNPVIYIPLVSSA